MATCPCPGAPRRTLSGCYVSFGTVRRMGQPSAPVAPGATGATLAVGHAMLVKTGLGLWRLLVAPAVIGLALATAACGGGTPKGGVASLGTTTTTVAPAGSSASAGPSSNGDPLRYSRCMRSHGVPNFPDPGASDTVIRAFKTRRRLHGTNLHDGVTSLCEVQRRPPTDDTDYARCQPPRDGEAPGRVPVHALARGTELPRPQSHHRRVGPPGRSFRKLPDGTRRPTRLQRSSPGGWSRASEHGPVKGGAFRPYRSTSPPALRAASLT